MSSSGGEMGGGGGGGGNGGSVGAVGSLAERCEAMAQLARRHATAMTPLQRMEGLRLVNVRLERRRRRWTATLVLAALGTATSVGAVVLLLNGSPLKQGQVDRQQAEGQRGQKEAAAPGPAIAYTIKGGEIGDGGYIRSFDSKGDSSGGSAANDSGSLLTFAEGSELRLMRGARGRLRSVDARGARFAIEEGQAEVKVSPRPGARWLVDAGPFLITVRGTAFTASWDGATERLDVRMKRGLVSVTGPFADGAMAVRAGQHLSVNVKKNEVMLRQTEAAETEVEDAGASSRAAPSSGAPTLAASDSSGRARASRRSETRSWPAALAAGDLDSILRDAERRGLRRSLAQASSEDLAALADAARYRRRNHIARQALLTARARFPRSSRASDSAFLLGRLEESRPDGEASALRWYDLYLKEAPSGAYSSEALGRKMTATERLRGIQAARALAEEYLRRFPHGTYAGAARALRESP